VKRQRGAALLILMVALASALAVAGTMQLRKWSSRQTASMEQGAQLTLAADALRSLAFAQRCLNTALPMIDLLPCPDSAVTEGIAVPSCPGIARGWLPWRTLGLAPLRDNSGTCLWYERQGTTARIIAAGGATPGQNRAASPGRSVCGGNVTAANYIDATDASLTVTLDTGRMVARCP
jgi:hypothetical protein